MSAIKQIVIFQLKALRMAGFLEFVQQVLNIVRTYRDSGEAGVSQLPAKVEAAYTPFVAGVAKVDEAYKISHSSEYTQQIADEDARRDSLYTALKKQVQMYTKFTFDMEKKSAATYLWNIIKKYNVDVNENYSEESVSRPPVAWAEAQSSRRKAPRRFIDFRGHCYDVSNQKSRNDDGLVFRHEGLHDAPADDIGHGTNGEHHHIGGRLAFEAEERIGAALTGGPVEELT